MTVRRPATRRSGAVGRGSALALPACLALVGVAWLLAARGGGWWAASLRHPLFVRCGLIAIGSLLALHVLLRAMARLAGPGRLARRSLLRDQGGSAMVEFALLFVVAMPVVLILVQVSLMMLGTVFTHYAAFAAARSAIVWVPADLPGEPRNELGFPETSEKLAHVRQAAAWALMPVAGAPPMPLSAVEGETAQTGLVRLLQAYDMPVRGWMGRTFARKYQYASDYTVVEIAPPADAGVPTYGEREDLHVTVRHRFYLTLPYVGRLFGDELDGLPGQYGAEIVASSTLMNQGRSDEVAIERDPVTGNPLIPQ